MKLNKFFSGVALTAMLGLGFASCSNELDSPTIKDANMLLRAPKAIAYSGNTPLTPGFGKSFIKTRSAEGVVTSSPVKGTFYEKDVNNLVEKTNEFLQEGNSNTDKLDTDFLYYADEDITFTLYCLLKNTNQNHYLGIFYFDENGDRYEEIVWESVNPNFYDKNYDKELTVQYLEGVQISIKAGYKFGFYWNGVCRPHEGNYTDENCVYYSIEELNEPQKDNDSDEVLSTHAGTFEIEGKTIIGLEDWYDFDYQDLVFFTDKALKKVPSDDKLPGNKVPDEELCPNPDCNHPVHDEGHCDQCADNEGCNYKDETGDNNGEVTEPENPTPDPETPDVPGVDKATNEVEVNLALDKKESDVLESHLSIHVRAATDVEIFIPVPAEYYCAADDLEIVMKHEANHMGHGGPNQFTWTLKDSDISVSLYVQYEDDGIRIWTDGVTQEVIDWCFEKCQDGITFEVWNYFNDPETGNPLLSIEELKECLNDATIKFLDKCPDFYINAFTEENGVRNEDDCKVSIVDEQRDQFGNPRAGEHNNGSSKNMIYENNNHVNQE